MATQGLQQQQKQVQTMVLAPQLRQSLKILQVATLDLRSTIMEELETNPMLEELPMEIVSLEERLNGSSSDADDVNEPDTEEASLESQPSEAKPDEKADPQEAANPEEIKFSEDFEVFTKLDEDWQDYYRQESQTSEYSNEAENRRQYFFDSLVSETSLQEHLMEQAECSDCDEEELEAIRFLIGSLDDRGFLTSSLSDIALLSSISLTTMRRAREVLRNFDPPGIGSEDIRECLLFQLELRAESDTWAYEMIDQWMDLLLRRRIPELSRKLGISKDEMYATKYCAGTTAFMTYFSYICGKTFLEGVSSHMLGGEAPIPGTYGRIAKRLQDRFGLDDKGVAYWRVHDTADDEHSGVGKKLLDQFATSQAELELVIDTVQTTVDVMHLMYDDIWAQMQKIGASAAAE